MFLSLSDLIRYSSHFGLNTCDCHCYTNVAMFESSSPPRIAEISGECIAHRSCNIPIRFHHFSLLEIFSRVIPWSIVNPSTDHHHLPVTVQYQWFHQRETLLSVYPGRLDVSNLANTMNIAIVIDWKTLALATQSLNNGSAKHWRSSQWNPSSWTMNQLQHRGENNLNRSWSIEPPLMLISSLVLIKERQALSMKKMMIIYLMNVGWNSIRIAPKSILSILKWIFEHVQ